MRTHTIRIRGSSELGPWFLELLSVRGRSQMGRCIVGTIYAIKEVVERSYLWCLVE